MLFLTTRYSILNDIRIIIASVDKYGSVKTWVNIANKKTVMVNTSK